MRGEAYQPQPGLQATLRRMVDPDYGLANRFVELGAHADAPDLFVTCVEGGPASYMVDHAQPVWANCSNASGAAYQRRDACWATLGELAERYCASVYERDAMLVANAKMLPGPTLPVENMILFSEAQYSSPAFPFHRYAIDETYLWQKGQNLTSGGEVFAPIQLLYLSNEWAHQMLMQTVPTGLACHSDPEAARLSAILELVERDGFAAMWALGRGLPRLHLSATDRLHLSLQTQKALENTVLRVSLYAIPNEFGVANIVAAVEHDTLRFGAFGAAAALSPYRAIEKAVLEAQHTWVGLAQSMPMIGHQDRPAPQAGDIKTPHDHAYHYMHEENWDTLSWFLSGGQSLGLDELCVTGRMDTSEALIGRLAEHGFETYLFDLTTPDIQSLGLQVVRAIVPGLQPLCFGAGLVTQDRRRLQQLARLWNCAVPSILTNQPHPFP